MSLSILLLVVLGAQTLSQAERDFAVQTLRDSRKQFLETVTGLSDRKWNYKPTPDRWSIAEIAEHLALTEDSLFEAALDSLKRDAPDIGPRKPTDEAVMRFMTDRSIKAQAPAELQPSHAMGKETVISRFLASRDRTIAFIQSAKEDLRHHYTSGPLGPMDAYQKIIGMSGHCEKHVAQMRDVKSSPGFPGAGASR